MALPNPGMQIERKNTALVITDPQNDFLNKNGLAWGVVGENVIKNKTIENLGYLFKTAKSNDLLVFISPHYYYKTDYGWKFEGALEKLMHYLRMFDRKNQLGFDDIDGSGADWLEEYKPYINDGNSIIVNPHKLYGPQSNDLILQLRKRGVSKVILAGMSANLCVESHLRELLEQGFEVAIVKDATAGIQLPEGDGYKSALTNFRFLANTVWTTKETIEKIEGKG